MALVKEGDAIEIPENTVYEVVAVEVRNGVRCGCLHWKHPSYPDVTFERWVTEQEYNDRMKKLDS
jgi:hypothetical protein